MHVTFGQVRPEERRSTFLAFGTLLTLMAGYALLETARDALFLSQVPAARLPWVYLLIAVASLVVVLAQNRATTARHRVRLIGWQAISATLTAAFWLLVSEERPWTYYALYVWSGVLATVVLNRFWLMLGNRFSVTQAKRLYALIGAGGALGAIVGSGVASALTSMLPTRHLLIASGLMFGLSALGPCVFKDGEAERRPATRPLSRLSTGQLTKAVAGRYAPRLGAIVLVSTIALTLVDYVFKSAAARHVDAQDMGLFFAQLYLGLNAVSLLVQLLAVRHVIHLLSIGGALILLPALLCMGGAGLAAGGGFLAALALKSADGSLRYSLHRTAVELLFVPMQERVRAAARTFIDTICHRGGQALASVGILLAIDLDAGLTTFAAGVVLFSAVWIALGAEIRRHYLEIFRTTLRESAAKLRPSPGFDAGSIEPIFAALNSANDNEVRAALDVLEQEGKARLLPSLILYHPSPELVVHALDILTRSGRRDFLPITDHLLRVGPPEVRAAVLRTRAALAPDESLLRKHSEEDCPVVSATALVGLVAASSSPDPEVLARVHRIAQEGSELSRVALANAIGYRPVPAFLDLLVEMAHDPSLEVRVTVLRAMAAGPDEAYIPALCEMLRNRELRTQARITLVALGEPALAFLSEALRDTSRPQHLRHHLPRTIMRFDPSKASTILTEQLRLEQDGGVRYKILRALNRLKADNPKLRIDSRVIKEVTEQTLERGYLLLQARLVLEDSRIEHPERRTSTQDLLVAMLRDKETNTIERLFRLLGLRYANEDFAAIFRGLQSSIPDVRASSRELLQHLLAAPERQAVIGLVDDASDQERLKQGGRYAPEAVPGYETLMQRLLDSPSESVRALAVHHIEELSLEDLHSKVAELKKKQPGLFSTMWQRTTNGLRSVAPRRSRATQEEPI